MIWRPDSTYVAVHIRSTVFFYTLRMESILKCFKTRRYFWYNEKYPNLKPADALLRGSSAPKIVVVGPSSSGKSTLVYLLVNNKIIGYLSIGIGDKRQTTIIPCEFIFDMNSVRRTFAVRAEKGVCKKRSIYSTYVLAKLYNLNVCDPDDTYDAMDEEWFELILEFRKCDISFEEMTDGRSATIWKDALYEILEAIDGFELTSCKRKEKSNM